MTLTRRSHAQTPGGGGGTGRGGGTSAAGGDTRPTRDPCWLGTHSISDGYPHRNSAALSRVMYRFGSFAIVMSRVELGTV